MNSLSHLRYIAHSQLKGRKTITVRLSLGRTAAVHVEEHVTCVEHDSACWRLLHLLNDQLVNGAVSTCNAHIRIIILCQRVCLEVQQESLHIDEFSLSNTWQRPLTSTTARSFSFSSSDNDVYRVLASLRRA